MLKDLIAWYMESLETGGYPLIALLMAVESSIVPLPSELVIPPAALLAHQKGGLSMVGIVLAGAIGSWIGATAMYWGSRWAGRPLVLKYGRYVLIPAAKVQAAEIWAARFGAVGVFISRLRSLVRRALLGGRDGWQGRAADAGRAPPHHPLGRRRHHCAGPDLLLPGPPVHATCQTEPRCRCAPSGLTPARGASRESHARNSWPILRPRIRAATSRLDIRITIPTTPSAQATCGASGSIRPSSW